MPGVRFTDHDYAEALTMPTTSELCPTCGQSVHAFMRFERAFAAGFNGWYGFLAWVLHA